MIACFLCAAAFGSFTVAPVGISPGQTIAGELRVEAQVAGAPAVRVEFIVDGWLRHTEREAPYVLEWDTRRELDGRHRLELWAVARDGKVATSTVDVVVSNPFDVRIVGVGEDQRVKGDVEVRAGPRAGAAQWLEVHVDGELQPEGAWDSRDVADGPHTITLWGVAPNGRVDTHTIHVIVRNGRARTVVTPTVVRQQVSRLQKETWDWQRLMRVTPTQAPGQGADFWRDAAADARRRASRPPHLGQFLCIHRYEGSWTANTGNGYFGGLQMNMDFQRAYGPELLARKGTANNWTPLDQIWVAERAVPGRSFKPWPQTARMCGLL